MAVEKNEKKTMEKLKKNSFFSKPSKHYRKHKEKKKRKKGADRIGSDHNYLDIVIFKHRTFG